MKKKVVVSGSVKLGQKIEDFIDSIKDEYEVLDYPCAIDEKNFLDEYKNVHKEFYRNIENADVLILFNEDKNGVEGYIGSAGFAEVSYAVTLNQLHNFNIQIFIYKMPSKSVPCFDEINMWLTLGWIKLLNL